MLRDEFNMHSKIKGIPEKTRITKLDFENKILHFTNSIQHHHRKISFPNQFVCRMTASTTGVLSSSNGTPSPDYNGEINVYNKPKVCEKGKL
jgi:hypothetical protein